MSVGQHSCIVIRCDTCRTEYQTGDGEFTPHFPNRKTAAASQDPHHPDRWLIAVDEADGPDLCPDCLCARDGHLQPATTLGGIEWCDRCGRVSTSGAVS